MKKHPILHNRSKDKRIKYLEASEEHFYLIENIVCVVFGVSLSVLKTTHKTHLRSLVYYSRCAIFHYSHALMSDYGIRFDELVLWHNSNISKSYASYFNVSAKRLLNKDTLFTNKYLEVVFELEKNKRDGSI